MIFWLISQKGRRLNGYVAESEFLTDLCPNVPEDTHPFFTSPAKAFWGLIFTDFRASNAIFHPFQRLCLCNLHRYFFPHLSTGFALYYAKSLWKTLLKLCKTLKIKGFFSKVFRKACGKLCQDLFRKYFIYALLSTF